MEGAIIRGGKNGDGLLNLNFGDWGKPFLLWEKQTEREVHGPKPPHHPSFTPSLKPPSRLSFTPPLVRQAPMFFMGSRGIGITR